MPNSAGVFGWWMRIRASFELLQLSRRGYKPSRKHEKRVRQKARAKRLKHHISSWPLGNPLISGFAFLVFRVKIEESFSPDDIAHDTTLALDGADNFLFGVLQSAMFTTWAKAVSGRLESRIRISPDLSYNSFPFPDEVPKDFKDRVSECATRVLEIRDKYSQASLADLYDLTVTPHELSSAHDKLDSAVDALFSKRKLNTIAEREAILFSRYQLLSNAEDFSEPNFLEIGR